MSSNGLGSDVSNLESKNNPSYIDSLPLTQDSVVGASNGHIQEKFNSQPKRATKIHDFCFRIPFEMTYQRVRDIKERQKPGTIEVRVLRKWISKSKKEELCYQFIDTYGDCIEATADVKHVEYFDSVIQLPFFYLSSNFLPFTYLLRRFFRSASSAQVKRR
ncbi:hypothetical protein CASFOL_028081 [Castilleja foliolosa]|uniref:Uncharacterized protein n=1 Tax=Castilleja foliolosa TaxID=1961234 RepID=A0ABD3CFB5_9LAMI